jgi:predicted transcriptional regulator of viral defense system
MPKPESIEPTQAYPSGKSRSVRPEEVLVRLGLRQHRQVTTEQIRRAGWSDRVLSDKVLKGRLHRVFAGVYSLGGPPRTEREWWMAAVLTFGAGTRLSDSSAAELYGWVRYPLGELHVTTTTERDRRDGITPHQRTRSTTWRYIDHIPVTGPEQTILDCAATVANDKLFRRIVRQAQAERATTHARLLLLTCRSAGVRGVARLRAPSQPWPGPEQPHDRCRRG